MKELDNQKDCTEDMQKELYAQASQSINHFGVSLSNDVTAYLND